MPPAEPLVLDAPSASAGITLVFHGTRGSIPAPGPDTVRHGGNTPSVEIRVGGRPTVILDAGSGIRSLGEILVDPVEIDLFLTHFHWDHIQGLPFFGPLYRGGTRLRITGPASSADEVRSLLEAQMREDYFPVSVEEVGADVSFAAATEGTRRVAELHVRTLPAKHPGRTVGYRIDGGGFSLAYLPDNELGALRDEERRGLVGRLRGVDLLVHDAMYRDDEYAARRGWGHSTAGQAVELAQEAGIHRLFLFHHAPWRSDDDLDAACRLASDAAARRGGDVEIATASEGTEVFLNPEPIS